MGPPYHSQIAQFLLPVPNGVSQNQYRGETAGHKEETDLEEDVSENEGGEKLTPAPISVLSRASNRGPSDLEVERGIPMVRIPRSDDKPRMQAATEHCLLSETYS